MKPSILSIEKWRIAIVIFVILVSGLLTDAWLISIALSLFGYIVWMYYKLHQFYIWITNGTNQNNVPDSAGIWDKINYQVLQDKNKSSNRKRRMNALLKRSQSILKGFPYATIVLNQNNEVDWSNSKSSILLNIVKSDRGQRINNCIISRAINNFESELMAIIFNNNCMDESLGDSISISLPSSLEFNNLYNLGERIKLLIRCPLSLLTIFNKILDLLLLQSTSLF
jgi:nitrate reductase NapE component